MVVEEAILEVIIVASVQFDLIVPESPFPSPRRPTMWG